MKPASKYMFTIVAAVCAIHLNATAAEETGTTNSEDRISYAIGMSIGHSIQRGGFEVNPDVVAEAIKDVLAGRETKMTDQQAQQEFMDYQQRQREKQEQERLKQAEQNQKQGEQFLAANKRKDGVKTHEVHVADGQTAELQYKVLSPGTGEPPKNGDTVTFHYRATLLNGQEVENSMHGGHPVKRPLNQIPIAGLKEALQLMKPGAKWELYVPASLAYGDAGRPNVPPGSALIYEVELVNTETPEPLTSDIIKVPSKEELDKGAKIEVIKAEDVKKMQQTNAAATNSAQPK